MKRLILPVIVLVVICFAVFLLFKKGPFTKGEEAFKAGDYETAATMFRECVDKAKRETASTLYLARIEGINGKYAEGIALCDKAIEEHPKRPDPYFFKAILLQLNGDMSAAEKVVDKFSNMPQTGKSFLVARITRPHISGPGKELRPEEVAARMQLLQGNLE